MCGVFNCHGLKQSSGYIRDLMKNCDILCLSETWLRPGEQHTAINTILSTNEGSTASKTSYMVCSVSGMTDADPEYNGRPYGGVSIICKHQQGITFKEHAIQFNNMRAVGIYDSSGTLIQTVISVYMPFYSGGDFNQTEKFLDSIEALQSLMDTFSSLAPVIIC